MISHSISLICVAISIQILVFLPTNNQTLKTHIPKITVSIFLNIMLNIFFSFFFLVRGGRREEGSGWGTRVHLWQIHVDICLIFLLNIFTHMLLSKHI